MSHDIFCPCDECMDDFGDKMRKANPGVPIIKADLEEMEQLVKNVKNCTECYREDYNLRLMRYPSQRAGGMLMQGFLCRACILDIVFPNESDKEAAFRKWRKEALTKRGM